MGFIVSEEGIKTNQEKVKAERNWSDIKEGQRSKPILGFTSYYRKFVRDYAKIVRPQNDLLIGHQTNKKQK